MNIQSESIGTQSETETSPGFFSQHPKEERDPDNRDFLVNEPGELSNNDQDQHTGADTKESTNGEVSIGKILP
jgi:hypothetical protein